MSLESSSHEFRVPEADWQEIDELVDDVSRLAGSDLSVAEFHVGLLQRAVRGLAAVGGAIWIQRGPGQIALETQIHLDALPLAENWADAQRHTYLLEAALSTGSAAVVAPLSAMSGHPQAANPTAYLLVLAPLPVDAGTSGVIEVFQRPGVSPAAERGYLRFLSTLSELAGDFQRNRQLRQLQDREILWGRFERFVEQIHTTLDVRQTAYTIANDGRSLVGCDRLSVGVLRGRKCRLLASSGVDQFDRRASGVQLLERLAAVVAKIDEPLWHDDNRSPLPPQIETPLEAALDDTHARAMAVLPLHAIEPREPAPTKESPGKLPEPGRLVGVLIAERFDNGIFDPPQRERIEAVARQSAVALANAQAYRNVPFMPALQAVGRLNWLPKALVALGVAAAVVAALVFVPVDFDVTAHGQLQPERRQEVFARSDGIVVGDDLKVAHGDRVERGQLLGTLRRPQLDFESSRIDGELRTAQEKLSALRNSRLAAGQDNAGGGDKVEQLAAEEEEAKAQLTSLAHQQEILAGQRADLEMRSPLAGTVLTWNVRELLAARPVTRGQVLLTVADLSGPWVLEIQVPDDRIGHVLAAEEASAHADKPLAMSFIVATEPGTTHAGHVKRIALATQTDKTTGATVLVTADFDRTAIPADELRPGATVVAKIHCGRRSLGYVWLHQLWETIQSRVLF
ncbi:MAG TPA: HlyD family efflux transporter periplasmic adaptor subunit [Pirellulales bacterium]|jgi:biotin carboxyl carrier protein|nr:HlyD family efflux transporter periplasmic adaptor subunit [Pirellulales bacterium]